MIGTGGVFLLKLNFWSFPVQIKKLYCMLIEQIARIGEVWHNLPLLEEWKTEKMYDKKVYSSIS